MTLKRLDANPLLSPDNLSPRRDGLTVLCTLNPGAVRFGDETDRYWRAFLKQWAFIDCFMVDRARGGWYATTTPEGRVISQDKASIWKAAYHNVRALVQTTKRLRRLALRDKAPKGAVPAGT